MQRASPAIVEIISPVVTGLDYEFIGAEFGQAENGQTLRVYIDKPEGIVLEDCAAVSRQLNAVLDVEDTIKSAYQLEVSSPGVDRPLFTEAQFKEQLGEMIRVKMADGVDGRRNFKGELVAVGDSAAGTDSVGKGSVAGTATIEVDGLDYVLPLDDIDQAYVVGRLA